MSPCCRAASGSIGRGTFLVLTKQFSHHSWRLAIMVQRISHCAFMAFPLHNMNHADSWSMHCNCLWPKDVQCVRIVFCSTYIAEPLLIGLVCVSIQNWMIKGALWQMARYLCPCLFFYSKKINCKYMCTAALCQCIGIVFFSLWSHLWEAFSWFSLGLSLCV